MNKDESSPTSPSRMEPDPGGLEGDCSLVDAIMNKYGSMASGLHDMGDVQVYFSPPARKLQRRSEGDTFMLNFIHSFVHSFVHSSFCYSLIRTFFHL